MAIQKTSKGWSVQLRIGASRRRDFTITAPDETVAEQRAAVMRECARLLVRTRHLEEAHESITLLGGAYEQEVFDDHVEAIRRVCADPLPEGQAGKAAITFRQLGRQWTDGELAKKHKSHIKVKKSVSDDEQRLEILYELPSATPGILLGDVPLSLFSLDDADAAMSSLPDTVQTDSSRRQYAQVIRRLLKLAVYPCKIIAKHPLPEGFCPKVNPQPKFVCIYPSEDARLLRCGPVIGPMRPGEVEFPFRMLCGLAVRIGARESSLLDLTWRDIDFATSFVRVLSKDVRGGEGKLLEFPLDSGTLAALKWWRQLRCHELPTACIFPQYDRTTLSKRLRAALLLAGVDRHVLHHQTTDSEPMRFHDLRASFVTFALLNGKPEAWIMKRTGHTTSQMIVRYRRDHYQQLDMTDWLPLDLALGLSPAGEVDDLRRGELPSGARPLPELRPELGDRPGLTKDVQQLSEPRVRECPTALPLPELPPFELPLADLRPDASGELGSPLALAEGQHLPEHLVTDGIAGPHEGLRGSLPGVAARVAVELSTEESRLIESSMIYASAVSGSTGTRTPDLRIKSSPDHCFFDRDLSPPEVSVTRDDTRRHDAHAPLPRSALTEHLLVKVVALAQAAQCWDVLTAAASDLDSIAAARTATPNVVNLLVERRKRGTSAR